MAWPSPRNAASYALEQETWPGQHRYAGVAAEATLGVAVPDVIAVADSGQPCADSRWPNNQRMRARLIGSASDPALAS